MNRSTAPLTSNYERGTVDAQPVTSISGLYPPLKPGYGEDAYVESGCKLVRVNESHLLSSQGGP